MPGTLYLVGTPIGNLEDITLRALRILKSVSSIAAEDTRQSKKLLHHYGIQAGLVSYHAHNEHDRAADLVQKLKNGDDIALIVDAGMPGISDPGYALVRAAIQADIPVVPIPGPTAAITGLVISGLPTDRFAFEGFLSRKGPERRKALERIAAERRTTILYEAPHRLQATLGDLARMVGDRPVALCRELTKRFEEVLRGTASTLQMHFVDHLPRGEFVVIVGGNAEPESAPLTGNAPEVEIASLVASLEKTGLDHKAAMKAVAIRLGVPRRQVYESLHKKTAPRA